MVKREIIKIDEDTCTGCGDCIPNCPEGALQIIDDKARIISDLFCDGLGACIGHCPVDAISIEEREAEKYDERKVMENVVKQGENVIKAHLEHLKDHGQTEYFNQAVEYLKENNIDNPLEVEHAHHAQEKETMACGCPGSAVMDLREEKEIGEEGKPAARAETQLKQWPVQIMLVPPSAPYFKNADLLIAADCVPFAYPNFHEDFLKGKILLVGCPKLDDAEFYKEKITSIFKENDIKSVTVAHMEVPCCFGLINIVKSAIEGSGKNIPFIETTIGVKGDIKES
ncbi:MAG: 4Fe-4S binding protein [Thermoplasmata archaeon]